MTMTSHQLARLLLEQPDLPIATHANNHTADIGATMRVGILQSWRGEGIIIGNFSRMNTNYPNEWVSEMVHGDVPEDWQLKSSRNERWKGR